MVENKRNSFEIRKHTIVRNSLRSRVSRSNDQVDHRALSVSVQKYIGSTRNVSSIV